MNIFLIIMLLVLKNVFYYFFYINLLQPAESKANFSAFRVSFSLLH